MKLHHIPFRILAHLIEKGNATAKKLAKNLSMSEHLVGFHLIRLSQQGLVHCEGELALATGLARSLELRPTYPEQ